MIFKQKEINLQAQQKNITKYVLLHKQTTWLQWEHYYIYRSNNNSYTTTTIFEEMFPWHHTTRNVL